MHTFGLVAVLVHHHPVHSSSVCRVSEVLDQLALTELDIVHAWRLADARQLRLLQEQAFGVVRVVVPLLPEVPRLCRVHYVAVRV